MKKRYFIDEELKKKCLKVYARSQPEYIRRYRVSIALELIGVIFAVVSTIGFFVGSSFSIFGLVAGFGIGFIFGSIPFFIGQSIGIKALFNYGLPFTKMKKEYLMITDAGVEFGYQDTDSKWDENMVIYNISADSITAVDLDGEVLTIVGEGVVVPYDDITTKRVNEMYGPIKYYWDTPFPILLAFDEREEIVERITEMKKN